MTKQHRGRVQAQGDGLEKSEPWAQDEPLSKRDGLSLLSKLWSKLTKKEKNNEKSSMKRRNDTLKMLMVELMPL